MKRLSEQQIGSSQRQGNIELLRIVCMLFVLIIHFNLNVILRNESTSVLMNNIALVVNSFVIVAVNCFILISGYFSIRLRVKSLVSFLFQVVFCSFIAVVIFLLQKMSQHEPVTIGYVIWVLLPFNAPNLWFVPSYFMLMLVSPLLNLLCERRWLHDIALWSALLCVFFCYGVYGYQGYSIYQFVVLYLLGRYIRLIKVEKLRLKRTLWFLLYLLSVAVTFVLAYSWVQRGHDVSDKMMYAYSSPWVMLSSVMFFIFFLTLNINRRWILLISPSVFSVYLLHENGLINHLAYINPLRSVIADSNTCYSDMYMYLVVLLYGVVLFMLIVIFDRFSRLSIYNYLSTRLLFSRK